MTNDLVPAELSLELHNAAVSHALKLVPVADETPALPPTHTMLHGGDARRGEQIFTTHAAAQCIRCHAPASRSQSLGPSLNDLGQRMSRRQILRSILEPSAEIHTDFKSVIVTLDDGRQLEGRLLGVPSVASTRTQAFEIIDRKANRHRIDPKTVESISSPRSPMPDDFGIKLTPHQLRDLVEFLSRM